MTRRQTRRRFLAATGSAIAFSVTGCLGSDPETQVEDHRSDLEPLGDVATAMDRDFRTLATYVQTGDGVLGERLLKERSGDPVATEPDIVTFDFAADGSYEPLALQWYVPVESADGTPSLFGRDFDGPIEDPTGLLPRHYDLTVWLFRENPEGLFARYHPDVEPASFVEDLGTARDALDDYARSQRAVDDGYENPEECASDGDGVYGVPFVGDTGGGTDLTDPPILRYRLTSGWSYVLLGAEWFVPAEDASESPELFGQRFHEPIDGHIASTGQPRHYGLHAWLFRSNPRGLFAPYNPALTCG